MGRSSTKPSTVWFIWLLLVGSLELEVLVLSSNVSRANATPSSTSTSAATSRRKVVVTMKVQPPSTTMATVDEEVVVDEDSKIVGKSDGELNYMVSKRRVPNGPDPIHNRRAGNSKRPPGRA